MGKKWLLEDEEILIERRPKWITYIFGYLFGLIFIAGAIVIPIVFDSGNWTDKVSGIQIRYAATIGLILFGLLVMLAGDLDRRKTIYYITNHRVRKVKGIISKKENDIPLNKITNIRITQGIIERIFGFGDVHVDTAGGEDAIIVLDNLANPREVYNVLFERTEKAKGEKSVT